MFKRRVLGLCFVCVCACARAAMVLLVLADYLNVFDGRVIMFPINHVLNGSPAEIEKAFKGLMDLIDTQPRGKGAQR